MVSNNVPEEISKLKKQKGKDIAIFGSSDLSLTLIPDRLIDEFGTLVNPVVLGSGKLLLQGIKERLKLKLLKTKTFNSGNILLYYEPI